jgi:hypothetical protein
MTQQERIDRGVALLDREYPGWDDEIDLQLLDLSCSARCICGQVDNWGDMLARHAANGSGSAVDWATAHGFTVEVNNRVTDDFDRLTEGWRETIMARRGHAAVALAEELRELVHA